MNIKHKRVNFFLKENCQIKNLILNTFPKEERIPMWWLEILSIFKNVDFIAYYDNDKFIGITYTIKTEKMIFLLYFAISENLRSQGFGTAIISALKENNPDKEIILNVEIPEENTCNYEERQRRIAFYQKNGFLICDFLLSIANINYNVLSTSIKPNTNEFKMILSKYRIGKIK